MLKHWQKYMWGSTYLLLLLLLLLCHAQTIPPGLWNGVDWRALVKDWSSSITKQAYLNQQKRSNTYILVTGKYKNLSHVGCKFRVINLGLKKTFKKDFQNLIKILGTCLIQTVTKCTWIQQNQLCNCITRMNFVQKLILNTYSKISLLYVGPWTMWQPEVYFKISWKIGKEFCWK